MRPVFFLMGCAACLVSCLPLYLRLSHALTLAPCADCLHHLQARHHAPPGLARLTRRQGRFLRLLLRPRSRHRRPLLGRRPRADVRHQRGSVEGQGREEDAEGQVGRRVRLEGAVRDAGCTGQAALGWGERRRAVQVSRRRMKGPAARLAPFRWLHRVPIDSPSLFLERATAAEELASRPGFSRRPRRVASAAPTRFKL